jgi:hypothetical protein
MNLTNKYPITIYRNEHNGRVYYKARLVRKDKNGEYESGYINCNFKKDVELENKTKINILNGWLDFYKKGYETIVSAFINEFEVVEGDNPFANFGDSVELDNMFLD